MVSRFKSNIFFLLLFLSFIQPNTSFCQDSLFTKYGDLLLGKIEKITSEKIYFKTAYRSSAVDIKIGEIAQVKSPEGFLLNDTYNHDFRGKLVLDSLHKGQIGIQSSDSLYFFDQSKIYEVRKDQKIRFKDRFHLGIDFGFARAKSENTLALSAGLNSRYRTRRWDTSLDYHDYAAVIGDALVARTSVDYSLSYIFNREWFLNGKASLFSSTEQELDLRKAFSGGIGKNIIHRKEKVFSIVAGIASNREQYTFSLNEYSSTEAILASHLSGRFWEKLDLNLDWSLFPSLSQAGRVRNTFDSDIKYLFLNHFNIGIHYVLNLDNSPPVESENRDFILEVKFGWSFQKR